jgi:hypothetical protein
MFIVSTAVWLTKSIVYFSQACKVLLVEAKNEVSGRLFEFEKLLGPRNDQAWG